MTSNFKSIETKYTVEKQIIQFFHTDLIKNDLLEFKLNKISKERFLTLPNKISRKRLALHHTRFSWCLNYAKMMRIFKQEAYEKISKNYPNYKIDKIWTEVFNKMKEQEQKENTEKILKELDWYKYSKATNFIGNNRKKIILGTFAFISTIGGIIIYRNL